MGFVWKHWIVTVCHTLVNMNDNALHKFWELEEPPNPTHSQLSQKKCLAIRHFKDHHSCTAEGCFIVPLLKESSNLILGDSQTQAVLRFLSLEHSLNSKKQFTEVDSVIEEYFELKQAKTLPTTDLSKPTERVQYLPIYAVYKQGSTTTKVWAVFDASAKSSS